MFTSSAIDNSTKIDNDVRTCLLRRERWTTMEYMKMEREGGDRDKLEEQTKAE